MNKSILNKSRQLSYLLRHNPENLSMDKHGWVPIFQILSKLEINIDELDYIVETNNKKRFGYDTSKTKIRAHQGHSKSLNIDIKFEEVKFPKTYYHGTAKINEASILSKGLIPQSRAYVHLSKDIETAEKVVFRYYISYRYFNV